MFGGRTIADDDLPEQDLLQFIDLLHAVSSPARLDEGDGYPPTLTAISFARFAQGAVEQNCKSLRQGTPTEYRKRTRLLAEEAILGCSYFGGQRTQLDILKRQYHAPSILIEELASNIDELEAAHTRNIALQAAIIMREIKDRVVRKGNGAGRPFGATAIETGESLQLSALLMQACTTTKLDYESRGLKSDQLKREDVLRQIRMTLKFWYDTGQLRAIGSQKSHTIDRYFIRLSTLLDTVNKSNQGPISIKWSFRQLNAASMAQKTK